VKQNLAVGGSVALAAALVSALLVACGVRKLDRA